jgi:lipopolysaccharide transport system permease protein
MLSYIKEVIASRELLLNLTLREVRGKYKRTVFGQLWSLANPLVTMLIFTLVFGFILRIEPDTGDPSGLNIFAVWLLCGLLPWTFFSTVLNLGVGSIVGNAGLVQKVSFSRVVLPLSLVGSTGFNWIFEMGVLVIVLLAVGSWVLPWVPIVIVVMVLLAIFASGIALMLSVANVYFRDTQYFVSLLLQVWFYLTPIIYPVSLVQTQSDRIGGIAGSPVTVEGLYALNPMVHFTAVFRELLYDNRWPSLESLLLCIGWAVGTFIVGLLVFRRNERGLAEAL